MAKPLGYRWLVEHYRLTVVPHHVASFEGPVPDRQAVRPAGQRARSHRAGAVRQDHPVDHLEFALKHEGVNPEILLRTLARLAPRALCERLAARPTGRQLRRLGFWYETLRASACRSPGRAAATTSTSWIREPITRRRRCGIRAGA